MSKRVQHIGHTTAAALVFTGLEREITIDTSKKVMRVHDGITKGGFELALASGTNIQQATALVNGIMTAVQVVQLDAATADILVNAGLISANAGNITTLFIIVNALDVRINANEMKLATIETGATTDQTKVDIDALGINAAQVDGKEAVAFSWRANNLSDLGNIITARSNLGLGTAAVENVGNGAGDVAPGAGSSIYATIASVAGTAKDSSFAEGSVSVFPDGNAYDWNTGLGTNLFQWGISGSINGVIVVGYSTASGYLTQHCGDTDSVGISILPNISGIATGHVRFSINGTAGAQNVFVWARKNATA